MPVFNHCPYLRNAGRTVATAPIIHYFMEMRGFIRQNLQSTTIIISMLAQVKLNLLVPNHRSNTTSLSWVSNVRGHFQTTELQLTSSSGKDTTTLVLCKTTCSNSCVSNDLANRLGFHGTALNLTVKGMNTEQVVDTNLVELTITPRVNQPFEPLKVSPYVKEDFNVGADVISIRALQEIYPHI